MGKHNKHRRFNQQQQPKQDMNTPEETEEKSPVDDLAAALGGGIPDGETEQEAPTPDEEEVAETQEPETPEENDTPPPPQPSAEPDPPKPVAPPEPPTPAPIKAVEIPKEAAPKVKIVSIHRPVQVSREHLRNVRAINNATSDDPRKHTMTGRQLIKMFDEYDALCAKANGKDEALLIKSAYKLYDIMLTCCPRRGNPNAGVYQEMISIVFKRLCTGYGTKYSDSSLFRQDYRLPSPSDSMKFDTFWHVMYQLVECAKTGSRITFNNTAVGKILNSPSAMVEITKLRRAVEKTI